MLDTAVAMPRPWWRAAAVLRARFVYLIILQCKKPCNLAWRIVVCETSGISKSPVASEQTWLGWPRSCQCALPESVQVAPCRATNTPTSLLGGLDQAKH